MENQHSSLGIPAFLMIIVSVTEMPYFIKYPLLVVALISLIIAINKSHQEKKAKLGQKENKMNH